MNGRRVAMILEGFAPGSGRVEWASTFETMFAAATPLSRIGLRLGILLAWLSPIWLGRRLRTLGGVAPSERAEILAAMLRHRLYLVRELTLLLKIVASMALLGTPEVRARSNYDREIVAAPTRSGAGS